MFHRKKLGVDRHGEDLLRGIESIDIKLESGETVTVKMAGELDVPDDPRLIMREAKRAPARLAFWSYQTERALARLRAKEREHGKAEGEAYVKCRGYVQGTIVDIATEPNVRAHLSAFETHELKTAKDDLAAAQIQYGVLRALRDASEHRSHLLRRLIAHEFETG